MKLQDIITKIPVRLPFTDLEKALLESGSKILDPDLVKVYKESKKEEALSGVKKGSRKRWFSWLFLDNEEETTYGGYARRLDWRKYNLAWCRHKQLHYYNPSLPRQIFATGVGVTEVPNAAIAIAEKIAATGVAAEFFIEQLDKDPFLVVCDVNWENEEYIFAWDEKGYIPR